MVEKKESVQQLRYPLITVDFVCTKNPTGHHQPHSKPQLCNKTASILKRHQPPCFFAWHSTITTGIWLSSSSQLTSVASRWNVSGIILMIIATTTHFSPASIKHRPSVYSHHRISRYGWCCDSQTNSNHSIPLWMNTWSIFKVAPSPLTLRFSNWSRWFLRRISRILRICDKICNYHLHFSSAIIIVSGSGINVVVAVISLKRSEILSVAFILFCIREVAEAVFWQ